MKRDIDCISQFILEDTDIKGHIVHLDNDLTQLLQQHNYPKPVENLLSKACIALILMNATIKYQGQLTLQLQVDGAILVAKCNHLNQFRAYANFPEDKANEENAIKDLLKSGRLILTIEQNQQKPHQSIISLEEGDIIASIEKYFSQSEQLPTKIWLAAKDQKGAGIIIQQSPDALKVTTRENFWQTAFMLGETLTDDELLSLDSQDLLFRLYHEQGVRLYHPTPVKFVCTCSQEKMQEAIKHLGHDDAKILVANEGSIDVGCQFCSKHYQFDAIDVEMIFRQ